ncbi:DUF2953 domain-containing protein [Paenibacillus sp. YN15]|uniref:DUF2953 domain-containing protein n=1 Tax=Paenibacillus sp. YN15 TaxID=1742774 RepID=UPI0015EB93B7|nr:DUF2953 domain-containing protein [Paenibacillus sp. YN15]
MTWWGWTLAVGAAVAIALLASKVSFELFYSRVKDNDRLYIYCKAVYGLVQYRLEVPVIAFKGLGKGITFKEEHVNERGDRLMAEGTQEVNKDKVIQYFKKAKIFVEATYHMRDWLYDTMSKVTCTQLHWTTRIGLGDAPETAITTGIVWTLKSSLLTFLFTHIKRCGNPKIQVIPDYGQAVFTTELKWKGQMRFDQACASLVLFMVRALKNKGSFKAWQKILSKPPEV